VLEPVELQDVGGFLGHVQRLGRGELHARGEFVAADAGVEAGVAFARGGVFAIQLGSTCAAASLFGSGRHVVGPLWGKQIGDRVVACRGR
jgi:hypothetical protein